MAEMRMHGVFKESGNLDQLRDVVKPLSLHNQVKRVRLHVHYGIAIAAETTCQSARCPHCTRKIPGYEAGLRE
jgi:hypothetical protein